MIKITCPQCNYTRLTPPEKIPSGRRWARCPKCGNRFEYQTPEGSVKPEERNATPWERRLQLGIWRGITKTIKSVSFSPKTIFSTMPITGGLSEPLAFGLLIGSIGSMFAFFWEFIIASEGFLRPLEDISMSLSSPIIFLAFIFLSPLLVAINLFISSLVLHFLLVLVRGGKNKFEATFRVVAYSQATKIWNVIPFIGSPIGWIWKAIVLFIGLKEAHKTSYTRIVFAFSIPFALLIVLISGFLFFVIRFINL